MVQDLCVLRVPKKSWIQPPKLVDLIDERGLPRRLVARYPSAKMSGSEKQLTAATSSTEKGFPSTYAPMILLTLTGLH